MIGGVAALTAAMVLGQAAPSGSPGRVPARPPGPEPGSELTVSLLTYETGGLIWERFGHNAIVIHDASTGQDHHYDYGRFSFRQAHFYLRFAQGKMWYSMGDTEDVAMVVGFYAREGRRIWAQELELTPAQRIKLRDFLAWNYLPEHREYAYDYYRDNCSTRIRDALDMAMGGAIRHYGGAPSGVTWREETRRLDQHNVALYTGLMIGLGEPVDREMTRWEQMFLPGRLREHLDSVKVTGPDGIPRPAVRSERLLAEGGRWPVPPVPADWTLRYLAVGLLAGGALCWLGRRGRAGVAFAAGPAWETPGVKDPLAHWARGAFLALTTLWMLAAGVLGAVLTWLWVFSTHLAAHRNENLLLYNLLALALAVTLPSAIRGKRWALKPARRLALLVAALATLGLVLKLVPGFSQQNLDMIALALPVHLGAWFGLRSPSPS